MFSHLMRLIAAMVTAAILSGCFSSEYDLSQQLKPEFPVTVGEYDNQKGGSRSVVTRYSDSYVAISPAPEGQTGRPDHLRFFRVPEFDYYIVQHWIDPEQGATPSYNYLYARVMASEITFLDLDIKDVSRLPRYLRHLVEVPKSRYFLGVTIRSGSRDTLYILREVGRGRVKPKAVGRFTRQ